MVGAINIEYENIKFENGNFKKQSEELKVKFSVEMSIENSLLSAPNELQITCKTVQDQEHAQNADIRLMSHKYNWPL